MNDNFAKNVIKELNKFRSNPKSIQHQCELIHKGLGRLRSNDPFLNEIQSFINQLEKIRPSPELKYNEALSEAAKKELPNFRGKSTYQKCRTNNLKGIVPDNYLEANPALIADDGADEPINVLTKTLLNRLDKAKEGRAIICDPKYTQVGIAHEVFEEENMVILIFASKVIENKPIKTAKHDFIMNIKYYESKNIKKPKYQAFVHHRIRGEIFGGENFDKTKYEKQIFSQGGNRPSLEKKDGNEPTLKGNKSELKIDSKYTSRTAAPAKKTRSRFPEEAAAKKEIVQETSIKKRNEGTSSKTETKTENKTTTSRVRGKQEETTSSTTKTITTRVRGGRFGRPKGEEEVKKTEQTTTTTTTTITKTAKRFSKGNDDSENVKKETKTVTKVEEKGNGKDESNSTTTVTKSVKRFSRGKDEPKDIKTETKTEIKTVTKVEEKEETKEEAGGPSIRRKYGKKKRF